MTTRVNIIYVRDTVARLLPFLDSILHQTTWDLNLVLNGCHERDERILNAVADRFPTRVRLITASSDRVLAHGVVLDRLIRDEPSPYFCIVDSDVFAMGPVELDDLLPQQDQVGRCSCVPIWQRLDDLVMPDGFEMACNYLRTSRADFLGCSYAAAYRTADLRAVLDRWTISMDLYLWRDLPSHVQAELGRRKVRLRQYDTAKVANILLQDGDASMDYVDLDNLLHLGGQSSVAQAGGYKNWAVTHRLRLAFSRWMPWVIAGSWRLRGIGRVESDSVADLARRRTQATLFLDSIADGTASFEDAPPWVADRETFDALCALLATPSRTVANRSYSAE